jgi:DNA-binding NarL/FixJ family response regulator
MRCARCCRASAATSTCCPPTSRRDASRSSPSSGLRARLLDLALPGAHGLDLLAELRRNCPRLPSWSCPRRNDRATIGAALSAGARGFIAKTADATMMLDAVRTVLAGGQHVTRDVTPNRPRDIDGVSIEVLGLTQRQSES